MQKYLNSSLLDLIRNDQLLPLPSDDSGNSRCVDFMGSDTPGAFEKNLKTQPEDWIYRHKKVEYHLNSDSYRTQEFTDINWAESVVIFGCSHVFGVGINEEDTISHQLSLLLKRPVINLGVGGSSMMFALHNSLMLHGGYPTPKAVVHLWTASHRTVFYARTGIVNYGPWDLGHGTYIDKWAETSHNPWSHAIFITKMSRQLWINKTIYYEATFFEDTAETTGCDLILMRDAMQARDLMHCGPLTMKATAMQIAKNLKI